MVKIKNYETVKTVIGPKKAIDFLWGSSRRTVAQYVLCVCIFVNNVVATSEL